MIIVDLFREELAFCEGNLANDRIIGLTDSLAHVCGAEYGPILIKEPLVVSEMIWVNCDGCVSRSSSVLEMSYTFEVVAHPRKTLRAWHIADTVAIDADPDRIFRVYDFVQF